VTRLRANDRGSIPNWGREGFFFLLAPALRPPALGYTQPPIQWDLSPGVKRPGSEAHHPHPSNTGVKNA
jgi:hypothetical protein